GARGGAPCRPFPWDDIAAFAFGVLGLGPSEFWQLTPREVYLVSRALSAGDGVPPERRELNQLMQQFPDQSE
ncbi:MAG: phage tail assembly chaperone, partial [Pseudomonadota bacterium]